MKNRVIDAATDSGKDFPIQPKHISIRGHFWDAFGNSETECSARFIVKLCQQKGGWSPFSKKELDELAREDFWFNNLYNDRTPQDVDNYYIVRGEDGLFRVTFNFIVNCYKSSPDFGDEK